nr:receptor-like protein kinase 5 [Ipomoea batatas]
MGSSSFSLFIVVISLTLASTATATYRVELSNETPGVQFDLHCELGGMNVGPATLAPSATATWNVEIFGGSYQDSDCTIRTDNESYHGYFLIFNENTYGTQCRQNGNLQWASIIRPVILASFHSLEALNLTANWFGWVASAGIGGPKRSKELQLAGVVSKWFIPFRELAIVEYLKFLFLARICFSPQKCPPSFTRLDGEAFQKTWERCTVLLLYSSTNNLSGELPPRFWSDFRSFTNFFGFSANHLTGSQPDGLRGSNLSGSNSSGLWELLFDKVVDSAITSFTGSAATKSGTNYLYLILATNQFSGENSQVYGQLRIWM